MTLVAALLVILLWTLAWVAQLWLLGVFIYRRGFRAAIDFLDGSRPLPPVIVSWRGALHTDTEKTEQ